MLSAWLLKQCLHCIPINVEVRVFIVHYFISGCAQPHTQSANTASPGAMSKATELFVGESGQMSADRELLWGVIFYCGHPPPQHVLPHHPWAG